MCYNNEKAIFEVLLYENTQIVFTKINKAELINCEDRNIRENEVRVKTVVSTISPGTERTNIMREFEYVFICFEDNGIGMTSKTRKDIFKPFYTTKSFIHNWGTGLSYVQKIVKMHSGNVSIKSSKNRGTQFYVLLPLV